MSSCIHIANICGGKYDKLIDISRRVYSPQGLAPTIHTSGGGQQEPKIMEELTGKVRKLTPKECWRLMGFTDEDFAKVRPIMSDTQLYKQAGNSIVVQVIEGILKELFKKELNNNDKEEGNSEVGEGNWEIIKSYTIYEQRTFPI